MANVLLTTNCNLHCSYCFAQERLQQNGGPRSMALDDAARVIAFLKRSNHPLLRLMGGEPTLHRHFPDIVRMGLEADMRIDLLSNCTWPEAYNDLFKRIPPGRLCFLLNIDHPANYAPNIWSRIRKNLSAVAEHGNVTLSFNIFEEHPRYEYLLELIRDNRIRTIRLSLSLPVYGEQNRCLDLATIRRMGGAVRDFRRSVADAGASVAIDNAVPLCMFTLEEAGELMLNGALDPQRNARCKPVIDIGPDLRVWCCFCLSRLWNRHLDEFADLQEMLDYYQRALSLYQGRDYPMDECLSCEYRERWGCQGGCLTYTVNRYGIREPDSLQQEPKLSVDSLLALGDGVEIRNYDLPRPSLVLLNSRTAAQLDLEPSIAALLRRLNGSTTAGGAIDAFTASSADGGAVARFTATALRERLLALLNDFVEDGFVQVVSPSTQLQKN